MALVDSLPNSALRDPEEYDAMDEAVRARAGSGARALGAQKQHEKLEKHGELEKSEKSGKAERPEKHRHPHRHYHHGWWWKTLVAGLALWIATVAVTALTRNSSLISTLILLGSFLIPFCVMLFVLERIGGNISKLHVIIAFFIGGICGVLGASLLEAKLTSSLYSYLGVGFIEEFIKALLLVIIGWRVMPKTAGLGALLGATIGAGFAAFESAGYAFKAAITAHGVDLLRLLQTEALRAILAPVGHVLWTAILGAAIFGAARGRTHFRPTLGILGAFVGVSLLHALWDSSIRLTALLALILTGASVEHVDVGLIASPAVHAKTLAFVLFVSALAVTAAIGLATLWLILRHHRHSARNQHASAPPA
ncbi:PrsW family intramembrane metalloprotease [Homoserinimonas sp. OAct 916]|uniref:PrsW family intramembrane metalloprotease n=1 Tax=Homoserinimonas sp. OAct 916 TaxID=2211450 RepID=UPI001E50ECA4|nr:PrsW family intramembrane metalloprotease [Homoserinimonas sp. OAct 916]